MRAMYKILVALSVALLVQGNRVLHHPVPDYADVHQPVRHLARGLDVFDAAPRFSDRVEQDYADVHQPVQSDDVDPLVDFDYDYGHTNLGHSIGLGSLSGLSRIHERGLARGSGSNLLGGLGGFSGLQGNIVLQPVQSDYADQPVDFDYDYGHTNLGQSIGLGSLSGLSRIHERGLARGSGSNLLGGLGAFSGLQVQGNKVLHHPVSDYADVHQPVQSDYFDVDQPVDFNFDYGHTNLGHSIGRGSLSGLSRIHERGLARGSGGNLLGGLGAFSGLPSRLPVGGGVRGGLSAYPGPVIDDSSIDPRFLSLSGAGDYFVGSHRADNP